MIVNLDAERLAALRAGGLVIRRGEIVPDGLMRPPDWTLYLTTVADGAVRVVGYLEGAAVERDELGTATPCDVDVTPVIDRLGCDGGAAAFARWASGPVVLTKNDADLLRWRLGLPLDVVVPPPQPAPVPPPPALPTGFEHDATALALLGEVYRDLASDANRMVLADRLLEVGDPRGELIALQLARARVDTPPSARERELVAAHGRQWTQPLAPYLTAFELRRGFVASATVDDRRALPPALLAHPVWSTVEDVETRNVDLLVAPALRSLRRAAVASETLAALAAHGEPLPITTIVGGRQPASGGRLVPGGVAIHADTLAALAAGSALANVTAMSLAVDTDAQVHNARHLLGGPFGRQLRHVELYRAGLYGIGAAAWWMFYRTSDVLSFGMRGFVDNWLIAIVRTSSSLVVQLGLPPHDRPPVITQILELIETFGRDLGRITIEQVGDDRDVDLQPIARLLGRRFRRVELARTQRWRTP